MRGPLTSAQIRGARGMLDWSMVDLARAASVSVLTIKRAEGDDLQAVSDDACRTIRAALEAAGVQLLADTGEGSGMRFQP